MDPNDPKNRYTMNAYGDLLEKVDNNEKLSKSERYLFCHDYLQRYSTRIMNEQEMSKFDQMAFIGSAAGMALAVCVPMTVGLYFQNRLNPAVYGPRLRSLFPISAATAGGWYINNNNQKTYLNGLSDKYF